MVLAAELSIAVAVASLSGRRSGLWLALTVFVGFLCWQAWRLGGGYDDCGCLGPQTRVHAAWVAAYDLLIVLACWAALATPTPANRGSSWRDRFAGPLALFCVPATLALVATVILGLLRDGSRPDFRQAIAAATQAALAPAPSALSRPAYGRAPETISLAAPVLDFSLMKVGDVRTMALEVVNSAERAVTIKDVQIECEACTSVTLTDRLVPPRSRLAVPVTFRALDRDVGETKHGLVVETDAPGAAPLPAAVVATVAKTAAAVPSRVALAEVPADGAPLAVAVRNLSDRPIQVLYARWTTKGIRVRCPAAPILPGGAGRVEIAREPAANGTAAASASFPIAAGGEVTLTLDHPDLRSIVLRIDGP